MKKVLLFLAFSGGLFGQLGAQQPAPAATNSPTAAAPTPVAPAPSQLITVDSPAWVFSPGNWVGDAGRAGKVYRQTWNPGAYFRVSWETTAANPQARLLFDTSTYPPQFPPPLIACEVDGFWQAPTPCAPEIPLTALKGAGKHTVEVYVCSAQQKERWGSPGQSGLNVTRVTGLQVDAGSTPVSDLPSAKWALIVGDSITEGIGGSPLACYSYLVGQALRAKDYEYGLSACGWSGWLPQGDNPPGDVPGYYIISGSKDGQGGQYDEASSRWDKIDASHSLLDSAGHLSAYGGTGQEPALILINYGTNDYFRKKDPSDVVASMNQCLEALHTAAPAARIVIIIPFSQFYAKELKQAAVSLQARHPGDVKISIIDLGPEVEHHLASPSKFLGSIHPNDRGYALIAVKIIVQLMDILNGGQG